MVAHARVAAVTGANKGIGLAIVRQLALQYPSSPFKSGPFLIYLTARSPERGAEAVKTLNNDEQLKQAKVLSQDGGDTTIQYHALDISDSKSIQDFAQFLQKEHPDGIDFAINNAGIALEGFNSKVVKDTLATNYYGTLEASNAFLPILRNGGRLVNVSSQGGRLNKYSDEITKAFRTAAETSVPAVTSLMEQFQTAVDEGREQDAGWPTNQAYSVSKAGETAVTKVLAMEEAKRKRGILVNACCPGYTKSDMTKQRGKKTADEGAQTPVKLALYDIGGTFGEFWYAEEVSQW